MKALEVLTKLVVGMSRVGDHLLKRKVSGIIVAALAFACGAGLAYALKREPAAETKPAPPVSAPTAAAAAPPPAGVCVPAADVNELEEGSPELQAWKNLHSGTTLPLDYEQALEWGELSESSKVSVLPSGRMLADAGHTLYMLDANKRVVWQYEVPQVVIDFAYIEATGLVYVTAGDNFMSILDAATGKERYTNSRNGSGGYGAVIPYGDGVCLVMDAFAGYRMSYTGGYEPMSDGVTAWHGTKVLWKIKVPPDAELQVVGRKIYAVTKTKDRILLKELRVPQGTR